MIGNYLFQGVSPTLLALGLTTLTLGCLLVLLGLGLGNPFLLRMGLRNLRRRPGQALMLLIGLALSTVVIIATLGLSDSFSDSATQQRLARMGNVDESVTGPLTQTQITTALVQLRQNRNVQAAAAIGVYPQSPTVTLLRNGLSVHDADLYAIPPAFDAVYGPLVDVHGQTVHFADLQNDEIFVSLSLAANLQIQAGDTLQLSFDRSVYHVRAVLANDLAVTTGEVVGNANPEVILSLARAQRIDPEPPDTICIRNSSQGGLSTNANGNRHQAIIHLLQNLFPNASASLSVPHAFGQTDFGTLRIHPLKPDVVEATGQILQINKLVFLSPIGQQFSWLPPLFALLLVGAGLLLLVLLVILLATERRAEIGMSRALGLQRSHLVQLLLFEGAGYAVLGTSLGLLPGIGATALELAMLRLLPQLGTGEAGNAVPVSVIDVQALHLWINWQSLLSAWCLGILTALVTILLTALWISRANIVTAIRDLDESQRSRHGLAGLWQQLWQPPLDSEGAAIPETQARRLSRRSEALGGLLWQLWTHSPLCLLAGVLLLALGVNQGQPWLRQVAIALLIAGMGLLIRSGDTFVPAGAMRSWLQRLAFSLIGAGWLAYGLLANNTFLTLFQPVVSFSAAPNPLEVLLSLLLPVLGGVVLLMNNADLLASLLGAILRRIRGLAAISRLSLAYPLTFRFRTGVTVSLLSLISFMILLLVSINLGAVQEAEAATNSGGFQLQATVFGSQLQRYQNLPTQLQAIQEHKLLGQDFATVGLIRMLYDFPTSGPERSLLLDLPNQPEYNLNRPPLVADDAFLSTNNTPMYARARGFTSDRQVWNAVRDHSGYAVLQYDSSISGLPASADFSPFSAEIPTSSAPNAHYQRVTIIGLIPASTNWRILMSIRTAATVTQPPYIAFINTYLLRLQPGINEDQAARDLSRTLDATARGITVQSLDQGSINGITASLTLFLGSYLALGLIFGALAISVIASRTVVERRQQIGMLRALGFSRGLVRGSFLLESGFVIALGLLIGTCLALWLAAQVAHSIYQDFPLPLVTLSLLLLSSFLLAFINTALPAQRAASLHPAEALRYE